MATEEYMTSQTYSASIGGIVYNVTVAANGVAPSTGEYVVTAYGADKTGVADSTASFQSAINAAEAAGGGEVIVPAGSFSVPTFLTMDSPNVTLRGGGASSKIIAGTASGGFVIKTSAANIKIKDLCFVGGVSTEPAAANECISMLSGSENTEISGCTFTGTDATHGFNVQIRGAAGCNNPRIENNYFERVIGTNSGYGYGIQVANVHGGVIVNNVSVQTTTQGRHHIYLSAGCSDITVTGNRLTGGVKGMINVYATMAQDQLRGCVISSNTLNGLGKGAGGLGAIHLLVNVADCSVFGNSIYDVDGYGVELEADGTTVVNCANNAIIGNTITNPDTIGIYVKGAYGASILSNRVAGAGSGTGAAAISLNTTGSSVPSGAMIDGNVVTGTTHTYALRADGTGHILGSNNFTVGTSGLMTGTYTEAWDGHTALSDVAYDDIVVSPASLRLPAAGAPSAITWKTDLEIPGFDAGGGEYAYFAVQLPHNYVPGTNILWHVHFTNDTTIADGQTVIFRFRFTSGPINGVMTALGNADATFTNNAAARAAITAVAPAQISGTGILADTHMIAGGATITGTAFGLSTVLYGRIERLAADTYTGEALLLSADAHIQKNRLGSENEYTG